MANPNPCVNSRFKPGQSGNIGGRPRKLLNRIDEMCQTDGKHPYTELMKLLPELKPREQAEVWLQLLSYCEPKAKEQVPSEEDLVDARLKELSTDELISLVKGALPDLESTTED